MKLGIQIYLWVGACGHHITIEGLKRFFLFFPQKP